MQLNTIDKCGEKATARLNRFGFVHASTDFFFWRHRDADTTSSTTTAGTEQEENGYCYYFDFIYIKY